ncbi:Ubiquitin-like protein ATG12, partial [Durusdinium trenchii]
MAQAAMALAESVREELERQRAGKVEVHVKAMGSAPALRTPRFTIAGSSRFSKLTTYLKDRRS